MSIASTEMKPVKFLMETFADEQEEAMSTRFTHANLKYLHNLLVMTSVEKINLPVDPDVPTAYLYQSECLRGRISILQEILSTAQAFT